MSVTTQNWELNPIMGSECSLLIYPSVCLQRWTECRSFSEAEPDLRLRAQYSEGEKAFLANRTTDRGQQCLIRDPEEALYVCKRYRQREWRLGMWGRGPILSGALSDVDLTLQAKENLGRL